MSEHILIVDDETEIADLVEVYLKNENYKVYKFYSAQDALECIEKKKLTWQYWTLCYRIWMDLLCVSELEKNICFR